MNDNIYVCEQCGEVYEDWSKFCDTCRGYLREVENYED